MKTVRDLIEALMQEDPDAPVLLASSDFVFSWSGDFERMDNGAIYPQFGDILEDDGAPLQ